MEFIYKYANTVVELEMPWQVIIHGKYLFSIKITNNCYSYLDVLKNGILVEAILRIKKIFIFLFTFICF